MGYIIISLLTKMVFIFAMCYWRRFWIKLNRSNKIIFLNEVNTLMKKIKLILVPGLDGSGELFNSFVSHLPQFDCLIIKLPASGKQDYTSLVEWLHSQLPEDDFLLIAESFSGPIVAMLAEKELQNLKSIIFVATFLSPPNRLLLSIAKRLPLKLLAKMPLSSFFHKRLLLGVNAETNLLNQFKDIISRLPNSLISARIEAIQNLNMKCFISKIPCLYLQASADKLLSESKYREFKQYFVNIALRKVDGPHFILQACPKGCAELVLAHVKDLNI